MLKPYDDKEKLIAVLKQQTVIPYNVIGVIENLSPEVLFDEPSSSVWAKQGNFIYTFGQPEVIASHFLTLPKGAYNFGGLHESVFDELSRISEIAWIQKTHRYFLSGSLPVHQSAYKMQDIPLSEAGAIDKRYEYQSADSLDEIVSDLKRGPSVCIYLDGQLASYAFAHEDNSLGYMYTLKTYRGRGLAFEVGHRLIQKMIERGRTPFLEIVETNRASQQLASKLGMARGYYAPWVGLKKLY